MRRAHASIYDANLIESVLRRKLEEMGIEILFYTTAKNVEIEKQRIKSIILDDGSRLSRDCFIETTG